MDDLFKKRSFERQDVRIPRVNPVIEIAKILLRSRALLIAFLLAIACLVPAGIWLIGAILPYLGQLLSILDEKDLKEMMESLLPLIDRI